MTENNDPAYDLVHILLDGFRNRIKCLDGQEQKKGIGGQEECKDIDEFESCPTSEQYSILYSGGLDSAVISTIVRMTVGRDRGTLHTFGVGGARDITHARQGVEIIDMQWSEHILTEDDILAGAKDLLEIVPDISFLEMSYELPLYFGASRADPEAQYIVTGQGADELFGGYARYQEAKDKLELMLMFDRDRIKLFTRTREVENKIVDHFGKTLIAPFLHDDVVAYSSKLEHELLISEDGTNKVVLRECARILGLPEFICSRPKLAAQYGSGISKVLKKLRKKGMLDLGQ